MHKRKYAALDATGSLKVSGRYNRGRDMFPESETWPALYLALGAEICLGEILRHLTPALLALLNDYRLTKLDATLSAILDCRDISLLGLTTDHLCHDTDYDPPRTLAAAARAHEIEGMLVPSATRLGDNLILFPDRLQPASSLTLIGERDPALYVPRL